MIQLFFRHHPLSSLPIKPGQTSFQLNQVHLLAWAAIVLGSAESGLDPNCKNKLGECRREKDGLDAQQRFSVVTAIHICIEDLHVYKSLANSSIPLQNANINSINIIVGASYELVKGQAKWLCQNMATLLQ